MESLRYEIQEYLYGAIEKAKDFKEKYPTSDWLEYYSELLTWEIAEEFSLSSADQENPIGKTFYKIRDCSIEEKRDLGYPFVSVYKNLLNKSDYYVFGYTGKATFKRIV